MIDQSAAYDLLCHENFAKKLKLYNFDEASVHWYKSYLGGRAQCVHQKQASIYNVKTVEPHKGQS